MNWNETFFNLCKTFAERSKDTSTKIGAVIVGPRQDIRSMGFNGFPRGVIDNWMDDRTIQKVQTMKRELGQYQWSATCEDRMKFIESRINDREMKLMLTEHAERNAIYNAASTGTPLHGCVIYVNGLPPCHECARAIIQAGITAVHYLCDEVPERWELSCRVGRIMLDEAMIKVIKHNIK